MSSSKDIQRYVSVDFFKGIAMIMIILVHYGQNFSVGIAKACQYMQMGCPIFFVASGFGIMCLIYNRYNGILGWSESKQFYYSRFRALAPGWYVTFIIVFIVNTALIHLTGRMLNFGTNRELVSIICNMLFLNGFLPFCNNNVMPGGWYIGTTVILYALTPFLLKLLNGVNNKRLFFIVSSAVCIILWISLFIIFPEIFASSFGYFFFLIHYPAYFMGIMLYFDIKENILSNVQIKRYLPLGIGSYVIAIALFYSTIPCHYFFSAWMTAFAAYFILCFSILSKKNGGLIAIRKIIVNYGRNSYCIYLLHTFFAFPFVKLSLWLLYKLGVSQTASFFILIPPTLYLSFIAGDMFRVVVQGVTDNFFRK